VRPGDTLSGIAARFGVGVHRLARANGLRVRGILLAGITLRVPAGHHTAPVATAPGLWSVAASIDAWSAHYGVDARLARAVAWQESGFHINIFSPAGAWGPMQIIPSTWTYVEGSLIGHPVPHTADGDIRIGVALLHHLIADFGGNESLAVAAYYQGERSVREHGLLQVTRWYVDDVMALRDRI
jgi:soluble lytic murein transglycosylase-like protein